MSKTHSRLRRIGPAALVFAIGWVRTAPAPGMPRIVMIIRHAEKPGESEKEKKDPNLSKKGFERADALATVIPEHFPRPDFLIATKRSKGSNRPAETITPLSKALHEEIEAAFKDEEFEKVAHAVLTEKKYDGKVVLIAWHHGKLPDLLAALGATARSPNWPKRWA